MTGVAFSALTRTDSSRRRQLGDAATVGVVAGFAVLGFMLDADDRSSEMALVEVTLIGVACGALAWRRRFPVVVLLVVVTARLVLMGLAGSETALVPAAAIAFYNAARHGDRRFALGIALAAATATGAVSLLTDADESLIQELLSEAAVVLLPIVFADAVRSREDRVASIVEAEATARVQEERLRIARDLHDVVAHALSAISVQSGVAAYNLDSDDPDDPVRLALERINQTGKRSLEDLRLMVGVLRSTDDAPLRPTPTEPDDFTVLRETADLAGVELTIVSDGTFPADVHDAVVVALHRIAQEALTNVARHAGPVPATLELRHGEAHVQVRVVNTTSTRDEPARPSSGVGIIGMRERAESLGGALRTQPLIGGGFEVLAALPYRPVTA